MSVALPFLTAVGALAVAYLVFGHLWHRVLSPLPAPDPLTFPRAGDRYGSTVEGVTQEIEDVRNGWVVLTVTLAPHAEGPPLHVHDGFAETFSPVRGVLHVQLADRVVQLYPGESLTVEAGVAHRPFNPTAEAVVLRSTTPSMPQSFAAALVQLYRVMDERGAKPAVMLLQMSVADPIFDTHLAAVPRGVQTALFFVLAPVARLLGYRNYYPAYALHTPAERRG